MLNYIFMRSQIFWKTTTKAIWFAIAIFKVASPVCALDSGPMPRTQKTCCLVWYSTVVILKFFISPLYLCLISEFQWDNRTFAWGEEMHTICMATIPRHPGGTKHSQYHMSTESRWTHHTWEFSDIHSKTREAGDISDWGCGGCWLTALRRQALFSYQTSL